MTKLARRHFLGFATATVAACASPKQGLVALSNAATDEARWQELRGEFLLSKDKIHLANLLIASNPRRVREAVDRFRKKLDEEPVLTLEHDFETKEYTGGTLAAAAQYVGGTKEQIALTDSTTSGLALVYLGLVLRPGDEILTTKHDHFATHESLRLAAEKTGATIKTVALYDDGAKANAAAMVRAIETAITPATRAIAMTWVHSGTGVKTPVRAIADVVAKANAGRADAQKVLLCVDGVHGFGVEDVTMADLGCDVFVAGCHKWILGPRGTGLVWAKQEAWARLRPVACPFHWDYVLAREYGKATPPAPSGPVMTPGGFRAYEHRWALGEAFRFHLDVGKKNVEARIHDLALRVKAGLAKMQHVTLHTPLDASLSSSVVTFEVAGLAPDAVVKKLLALGVVASSTPYFPTFARLTPGITNTPDEIDRALAAVRSLA